MVDNFVIMNTSNNEDRAIVTTLAYSLLNSLSAIPTLILANLFFGLDHLSEKLDVTG